ncbi:deoxynucleotide monophosphate kinase family protein [Exiguobacterium sp. CinTr1]|uniref:deoxynucleotide monophosphate kinase family protein n=1 Tax=Exiguobacterium sp. CinTr1 TaxID=2995315 RepID=UPI0022E02962|nr:AAA family ATPase [Exiguobacterium sp. CinTr1]
MPANQPLNKPLRIAIYAPMRSGKSEAARLLVAHHGFVRRSFGGALKAYAHDIFGTSDVKPRALYQQFGQLCRQIDPDVWVRHLADNIANTCPDDNIVIDDLRQPNEYAWARANGFVIVKIETRADIRKARLVALGEPVTEDLLTHETEQHFDAFEPDYVVPNDGDTVDLRANIAMLVKHIESFTESDGNT